MVKSKKVEIAAQLYTVRAFTQTEKDIAETLAKVKKIGYDSVQVSAFGPYRTEFLADVLKENGLSVCATHTPLDRILKETDQVIKEHKTLNIPCIGLGYARLKSVAEIKEFLAKILPAAEKIRDAGLQFVYHNHHWEFVKLEGGVTAMQYLLENTPADVFGLLPDMFWLQSAGITPSRFLRENAARIQVIHLKDMQVDGETGTQKFAVVGEGNMDYASILDAAEEVGVRYAAVEQDNCYGEDPFDCLKRSRENLARMGY